MRVPGEVGGRVLSLRGPLAWVGTAMLSLAACRSPGPPPVDPLPLPPEPTVEEPEAKPAEPLVEREFAESRKLEGSATEARYVFEGEAFTSDLELQATLRGEQTRVELRHPGGPSLVLDGPSLCTTEFYDGDSLVAQILDHGSAPDGRRLLELWVSCRLGEDIVSVESAVSLLLDDGKQLARIWSGEADYHGSWVCATYDQLEFVLQKREVVLTRSEIAEIYEPGIEEYDCEDAREYVEPRGTERIALP